MQKRLRGHQPAPYQYSLQLPTLRCHHPDKRHPLRAGRAEDSPDQPTPRDAADRGLQGRPRQWLRQHAALIHAALHRQQPDQDLLLRQQQHPPLHI